VRRQRDELEIIHDHATRILMNLEITALRIEQGLGRHPEDSALLSPALNELADAERRVDQVRHISTDMLVRLLSCNAVAE
jgi:hypothetical protein